MILKMPQVQMIARKNVSLKQEKFPHTDTHTHGILTGWVAPHSMQEVQLKMSSRIDMQSFARFAMDYVHTVCIG